MSHVKNIIKYIPSKIIPGLGGLIGISLLSKNLTLDKYGVYSLYITAALVGAQLGMGWISNNLINNNIENIKYGKKIDRIIIKSLLISISIIPIIVYGLIISIANIEIKYYEIIVLIILSIMIGLNGVFISIFQSIGIVKWQQIGIIVQISSWILILWLIKSIDNFNLINGILAYLAGWVAYNFILFWVLVKIYKIEISNDSEIKLEKFVRTGLPYVGWFAVAQMFNFFDKSMLMYFTDAKTVGLYSAYKDLFVGAASIIIMPIMMTSHPSVALDIKARNYRDAFIKINLNVKILSTIFLLVGILYKIIGEMVIKLLLGEKYSYNYELGHYLILYIYITAIYMNQQKILEVSAKVINLFFGFLTSLVVFIIIAYLILNDKKLIGLVSALIISALIYYCYVLTITKSIISKNETNKNIYNSKYYFIGTLMLFFVMGYV